MTCSYATGTIYYEIPRAGRVSIDLQRTSMFEDGIKAKEAGDQIKLMDLAELVNMSMKRDGGSAGFAQGAADENSVQS